MHIVRVSDPQMVSHLFRVARVGGVVAGAPRDTAAAPPSYPSRGPSRDLLLHHDRLAELAAGEVALLEHPGGRHRVYRRVQAPRRRHEMGTKGNVIHFFSPAVFK
jgi:hypothetical protein